MTKENITCRLPLFIVFVPETAVPQILLEGDKQSIPKDPHIKRPDFKAEMKHVYRLGQKKYFDLWLISLFITTVPHINFFFI